MVLILLAIVAAVVVIVIVTTTIIVVITLLLHFPVSLVLPSVASRCHLQLEYDHDSCFLSPLSV